jgi:type I restriction enzyme S subunit
MQRFQVKPGDFIISCSGTIGRIYQIPCGADPGIINQALLKISTDSDIVHDRFFYLTFEWDKFQERIIDSTQGGAMQNLVGMDIFKTTPVILPPPPEQRAIAAALADVDGLITALDRLIAKKRAIKQATMQQLLTGKTRLPGFGGEWEHYQIGNLGSFSKGRGIRRDDVSDDGVGCIRYGEIYTRYNNYVLSPFSRIPRSVAANALPIKHGDILFAGSGETAEEIGKCVAYLGTEEAYAGGDIVVLTPLNQNSLYLGHLLNHETVAVQKARMGQGDAVVHISAHNLAKIEIELPPIDEQAAIAAVLSDMDAEIAALEQRRDKTQAIKQGMMQQLLTGRIRLTSEEVNV